MLDSPTFATSHQGKGNLDIKVLQMVGISPHTLARGRGSIRFQSQQTHCGEIN